MSKMICTKCKRERDSTDERFAQILPCGACGYKTWHKKLIGIGETRERK